MTYDLVITGGTLVTASDTIRADLAIHDGQIAATGSDLRGKSSLDARDKLVLPGGVDPHVHLQMPAGKTVSSDDWRTGTVAAACGGTTTVIDFVEPEPGQALLDALQARLSEATGQSVIDYGLHMTLTDDDPATLKSIPACIDAGITSFKTYTTYDGFKLTDAQLIAIMEAVGKAGGLVITHCENDAIVTHLSTSFIASGKTTPRYHPLSRPTIAEAEAIQRVLALASITGVPIYIVHVSTELGSASLARARSRGQDACGETCPQYLLLSADRYDQPGFEGAKYVCSPPLRGEQDQITLWQALAGGTLQAVGTDHCPFYYAGQKDLGRDLFTDIPGGLPGIEARLALVHHYGVNGGRMNLNRWVEVCSTGPAQIFGLYPRKGSFNLGADADVVIFDPTRTVTITQELLHENVDYTPYEKFRVIGWPDTVLSRGQIIVENGQFVGQAGHGEYVSRPGRIHQEVAA